MGKTKIIFYGTPEFAVPSLEILLKNNHDVAAVVTAPDKPAGRGQEIRKSAVKEFAEKNNLKILQPENLKDETFLSQIKSINPDLQIVVAFRMLPEAVWKYPKLGTFNLHASLLPQYRGAAPINWAMINGEKETGVTTFFLQQEIDTGKVIMQEKVYIAPDETLEQLYSKLMTAGAELVLKTTETIQNGKAKLTDQSNLSKGEPLKLAPKLTKQNTKIDLHKFPNDVHNFVRGLSPYPCAHLEFEMEENGVSLMAKIFSVTPETATHNHVPGTIETDNKSYMKIFFRGGFVNVGDLQIAGRDKMPVKDFLNGFKFTGNWKVR